MKDHAPFIDNRLYMKWTEDLGYGIFTKEPVRNHAFLEIAPVIIFEPPETIDENLMKYVIAWEGKLAVALGWTMMYNHSDRNNCVFSLNHHDCLIGIMAIRDIKENEQITVDYGPEWFTSRGIEKVLI